VIGNHSKIYEGRIDVKPIALGRTKCRRREVESGRKFRDYDNYLLGKITYSYLEAAWMGEGEKTKVRGAVAFKKWMTSIADDEEECG
jgi:hypothetical protein